MANNEPVNGDHKAETSSVMLTGPLYDKLKFLALVVLPALATLYLALGGLWDQLFEPEKVAGTIMAVDAFLGIVLGLSSNQFKAVKAAEDSVTHGSLLINSVNPDTGIPNLGLDISAPLVDVGNSDTVKLKVVNTLPPDQRIPG